eukprot:Skav221902  [mRNA]  locus=scaffold1395:837538:838000:- [translate_table: standard]
MALAQVTVLWLMALALLRTLLLRVERRPTPKRRVLLRGLGCGIGDSVAGDSFQLREVVQDGKEFQHELWT